MLDKVPDVKQLVVALDMMQPATRNPNAMGEQEYASLVALMRRVGCLQPVLLRRLHNAEGGTSGYEIIDGHHRVRAAGELGWETHPALVIDCTEQEAEVLRAAMNRLRGQLDLAVMSDIVRDLHDAGWKIEDMTLTGFSSSELDDLLAASVPASDEAALLNQAVDLGGAGGEVDDAPVFLLEVKFDNAKEMARAKRALKKAGKGDMARGIMALLGEA